MFMAVKLVTAKKVEILQMSFKGSILITVVHLTLGFQPCASLHLPLLASGAAPSWACRRVAGGGHRGWRGPQLEARAPWRRSCTRGTLVAAGASVGSRTLSGGNPCGAQGALATNLPLVPGPIHYLTLFPLPTHSTNTVVWYSTCVPG